MDEWIVNRISALLSKNKEDLAENNSVAPTIMYSLTIAFVRLMKNHVIMLSEYRFTLYNVCSVPWGCSGRCSVPSEDIMISV